MVACVVFEGGKAASAQNSEEMGHTLALTRKLLEGMGIEERQIETIIEAHADTVNGLKADRDKYRDEAAKVPTLQKQLEEAKADTALADLQAKYDELAKEHATLTTERDGIQSQFDAYKEEVAGKEAQRAKASAYRSILKDAGIADKYLDSVMRVADLSAIELEDGTVKGADELAKKAKEDWADFIVKTKQEGSSPETPPTNTGSGKGIEGANPIAIQIAKERAERLYGKSEE